MKSKSLRITTVMKKFRNTFFQSLLLSFVLFFSNFTYAQSDKDKKIMKDCDSAKAEYLRTDPSLSKVFASAIGYVIFPNVGKGAVGVGGASGNGIVYEKGVMIGKAKMSQVSVGFQFGGQAYRELIFFENAEALDRFKKNKFEFSAQASAVAVKSGASANAKYNDGVMIYTQQKGGLMYEASVGGQKFKFSTF
jgi:lipid-binding SYLF domain-containing protein